VNFNFQAHPQGKSSSRLVRTPILIFFLYTWSHLQWVELFGGVNGPGFVRNFNVAAGYARRGKASSPLVVDDRNDPEKFFFSVTRRQRRGAHPSFTSGQRVALNISTEKGVPTTFCFGEGPVLM